MAIWGLTFKPDTDDMRDAPSLVVIEKLLKSGATVRVFDPIAMEETAKTLGNTVVFCKNAYDAAKGADAIALITEWKPFRLINWDKIKDVMTGNVIVDGRNIYSPGDMEAEGFRYFSIGKKHI